MTGMRVILDQIAAPIPGGIGRYARELTRSLIATAPLGASVTGYVASSPESEYDRIRAMLPGLADLEKSALDRRQLAAAWQHGFTRLRGEHFTHAPSLLAPLYRHDRINDPSAQVVVTVHDAVPWTHPETLTSRGVSWHRAMARRAERFADAIVVPTHAVAEELSRFLNLGERVRVIGGAVSADLVRPPDDVVAATRLEHRIPAEYVICVGTLEPRKGLPHVIEAMSHLADLNPALVIVGPQGWGGIDARALAAEYGLEADRLHVLGSVSDDVLAALITGARVYVMASDAEGFGLPLLEAMSLGTPTIHTDVPALVEVAAGAGLIVPRRGTTSESVEALVEALRVVLTDDQVAGRLRLLGMDRARAFSWRDSAEKVWQLHADL